ncbi:cysteine--tRNA ligase [Helicobacter sp.]|uniref:cysteine--tRNA ligase n=1 Tax=Helicobacter sp. TaxID=218 RepID=UPI0038904BEB
MTIYDSKQKKKLPFISIRPNTARIYVCGPTVYDDAHLGHARSSIAFDLLRRTLVALGYDVVFVKNFTDIDDKIINKANTRNLDIQTLAQGYIDSYLRDMEALGVLKPDIMPKASENLRPIAQLVSTLLERGNAYTLQNGDIYLHVPSDPHYGEISARGIDDENQARIHNDEHKKDPRDFALWKSYKGQGDVGYESPLGKGRPGWHIECSAMIEEVLAYQDEEYAIDIHGGGADLLFPHHENEACQSRCATDKELAKYWVHNGFVNIDGQKMSKSLGNSFYVKDAIARYGGEVVRNYLLGTHYRALLHFSESDLLQSKKRLDKIYRLKKRLVGGAGGIAGVASEAQNLGQKELADAGFCNALLGAMRDDLNISKALSVLEEMLNHANAQLDSAPKDKALKASLLANLTFVQQLLGIGGGDCVAYFQQGVSEQEKAYIQEQIALRAEAKAQKNYAKADAIRTELESRGIVLSDSAEGTIWERLEG